MDIVLERDFGDREAVFGQKTASVTQTIDLVTPNQNGLPLLLKKNLEEAEEAR